MMYSLMNGRYTRNKSQMYSPMHNSFANYCDEALQKSEMKLDYENEIFLNNLHLIPDPLMKNLADTLITSENPEKVMKQSLDTPIMTSKPIQNPANTHNTSENPEKVKKQSVDTPIMPPKEVVRDSAYFGIPNFFSGVLNMLTGAVFRTRSQDYDCFDAESRQGSPQSWLSANDVQDKNGQATDKFFDEPNLNGVHTDMNNCKAVSSCEEKINKVRYLLTPKQPSNSSWLRKRPKKVFVEPSSIEESFEDAFSPEDFVSVSNDPYMEYYCPPQCQSEEFCEAQAPESRIQSALVNETVEIVKEVIESESNNMGTHNCDLKPDKDAEPVTDTSNQNIEETDVKHQLVSSCEDKLSKLKDLLKVKTCKIMDPSPEHVTVQPRAVKTIPINKPVDKHFKNPHRMLDKRQKMKTKRNIQDDAVFANEIDISPADSPSTPPTFNSRETGLGDYLNDISPAESLSTPSTITSSNSLGDYFDELKGRFRSTSTTESEDSFQIVFKDSPKPDHKAIVFNCPKREHKASDCESEDSFILFEDNDNCYTSNDVFGDSDSDVSDSGCSTMTCKLSHSLSRTVSNLTDDTLYESSDEVDCTKVEKKIEARGMLMDADRRNLRKDQPMKKVHFSEEPPTVRVMRVWAFAARQARAGHWERFALDRDRFKRRIADVDMAVSWVLKPQHRSRVMFQRFMPLWNRQKRQEIAEKKERLAEEKRAEAERLEEEKQAALREEESGKDNALDNNNVNCNTANGVEAQEAGVVKDGGENIDLKNENINKAMENLRKYNNKKNNKKERNNKVLNNVGDSKKLKSKDVKVVTENNNNSTEVTENNNKSNELVKTVNTDNVTAT